MGYVDAASNVPMDIGGLLDRLGDSPTAARSAKTGLDSSKGPNSSLAQATQQSETAEGHEYESITDTEFQRVDMDFTFSKEIRRKMADPDHTVILNVDGFDRKDQRVSNGPQVSHGGMINAILRSQDAVKQGLNEGNVTIVNLHPEHLGDAEGDTGPAEHFERIFDQIPDDYKSQILLNLSISGVAEPGYGSPGFDGMEPEAEWQAAEDRLKEFANKHANSEQTGNFRAFIANGNHGVANGFAARLHDEPGITQVASGDALIDSQGGPDGDIPIADSSIVYGDDEDANVYASRIRITADGDMTGNGIADLALPDPMELSAVHGSQSAQEFLDMRASDAFASDAQARALRNGGAPESGVLYSLADIKSAGENVSTDDDQAPLVLAQAEQLVERLTGHMENPDLEAIHIDPVAASAFIESDYLEHGVVMFEQGITGDVQRYASGDRDARTLEIEPSTSYAAPMALADFLREQRGE